MARIKRKSASIDLAQVRAASLASIDPALDLANGNTLAAYNAKIAATQKLVDDYNTTLGSLDGQQNTLNAAEHALETMTSAMMTGVGLKFGKDSNEYEKAGGTRTSDRKSPKRKPKGGGESK